MTYQVLARKWRPRNFNEMVGQEHVLRAVIHALDSGRIHHAFLFTGTRGVGKTTIARILAKSLNCERGVSSLPCGTCVNCQAIDAGRFVDLIEVDAASRTKVEDTRELLDNVQYAPSTGRYKIYLIDEVHMFSNHSFNALLKTLEEPPPHVKFLLATTDPQRLPITILSRCLQFNLRRLSPPTIHDQLVRILNSENLVYEDGALRELARAADGSMRDGLSLLDQAIAYGNGRVTEQEVYAMLGTLSRDRVYTLLENLAAGNASSLISTIESFASELINWNNLLEDLIWLLQRIALAQFAPEALNDQLGDRERILALAQQLATEDVQLYYQIGLLGRRDLHLAPQPRLGFEMTLLRMLAFHPVTDEVAITKSSNAKFSAQQIPPSSPTANINNPNIAINHVPKVVNQSLPPASEITKPVNLTELNWAALIKNLGLSGLNHQLAMNCSLKRVDKNTLYLTLVDGQKFLLSKEREQLLEQAVQNILGSDIKIAISVAATISHPNHVQTPAQMREQQQQEHKDAAHAILEKDPLIKNFREVLDAEIDPQSIKLVNKPKP